MQRNDPTPNHAAQSRRTMHLAIVSIDERRAQWVKNRPRLITLDVSQGRCQELESKGNLEVSGFWMRRIVDKKEAWLKPLMIMASKFGSCLRSSLPAGLTTAWGVMRTQRAQAASQKRREQRCKVMIDIISIQEIDIESASIRV